MNFFNRRFEKFEDEIDKKEEMESNLKKLRNENLGKSDTMAIIIAIFQLIVPYVIGFAMVYFLVIQLITRVWLK